MLWKIFEEVGHLSANSCFLIVSEAPAMLLMKIWDWQQNLEVSQALFTNSLLRDLIHWVLTHKVCFTPWIWAKIRRMNSEDKNQMAFFLGSSLFLCKIPQSNWNTKQSDLELGVNMLLILYLHLLSHFTTYTHIYICIYISYISG